MRKKIRPLISTSVLVIMIGAIFLAGKPQPTAGQQNPQPTIDLSGKWKLDSAPNETIVIEHVPDTGKVLAIFSPAAPCLQESRTTLFDTRLKITSVSGSDPKLSLEDSTFWSCTGDPYMIPACGTAVWESSMRNVTVSPDGNTISGKRFYEGLTWDGTANEQYVNCRKYPGRDDWVSWTLTRCTAGCADIWRGHLKAEAELQPAFVCDVDNYFRDTVEVDFSFSVEAGRIEGTGTATLALDGVCEPTPGQSHSSVFYEQVPTSFPIKVTGRSSGNAATLFLSAPGVSALRTRISAGIRATNAFSPWGFAQHSFRRSFAIQLENGWSGTAPQIRIDNSQGALEIKTDLMISK